MSLNQKKSGNQRNSKLTASYQNKNKNRSFSSNDDSSEELDVVSDEDIRVRHRDDVSSRKRDSHKLTFKNHDAFKHSLQPSAGYSKRGDRIKSSYEGDIVQVRLALERSKSMAKMASHEASRLRTELENVLSMRDEMEEEFQQASDRVEVLKREIRHLKEHINEMEHEQQMSVDTVRKEGKKYEKSLKEKLLSQAKTISEMKNSFRDCCDEISTKAQLADEIAASLVQYVVVAPRGDTRRHAEQNSPYKLLDSLLKVIESMKATVSQSTAMLGSNRYEKCSSSQSNTLKGSTNCAMSDSGKVKDEEMRNALIRKYQMHLVHCRARLKAVQVELKGEQRASDQLRKELAYYKAHSPESTSSPDFSLQKDLNITGNSPAFPMREENLEESFIREYKKMVESSSSRRSARDLFMKGETHSGAIDLSFDDSLRRDDAQTHEWRKPASNDIFANNDDVVYNMRKIIETQRKEMRDQEARHERLYLKQCEEIDRMKQQQQQQPQPHKEYIHGTEEHPSRLDTIDEQRGEFNSNNRACINRDLEELSSGIGDLHASIKRLEETTPCERTETATELGTCLEKKSSGLDARQSAVEGVSVWPQSDSTGESEKENAVAATETTRSVDTRRV